MDTTWGVGIERTMAARGPHYDWGHIGRFNAKQGM